jgi:hypothetical protein
MMHGLNHTSWALAAALATSLLASPALGNVVSGAELAPLGANDIEIKFKALGFRPNFVRGGSTLPDNPGPSIDINPGFGSGTATFNGLINPSVTGWVLDFDSTPVAITSWFFTVNRVQTSATFSAPTIATTISGSTVQAIITNPDPETSMSVTNFNIFVGQDPNIVDNLVSLADFSSSPFSGTPLAGIPTSFTLDTANPEEVFTFVNPIGSLFAFAGISNGADFRNVSSAVPEPSQWVMLCTGFIGLFCYSTYWRRGDGVAWPWVRTSVLR